MLAVLTSDNESLVAVMSAAPAANQPVFMVNGSPNLNDVGVLTGITVKALKTGVDGEVIKVESLLIYNKDTSDVAVVVSKKIGSTTYNLINRTIPAGGTLHWDGDSPPEVSSGSSTPLVSTGAASHATVAAAEGGTGPFHQTVLTLTDFPVLVGNTTGISFGSRELYAFPQGRISIRGCTLKLLTFKLTDPLNVTPIATTHGGDVAVGTTATADATLTGTDVDLLPSTSIDPISAGIAGATLAADALFDGTTTAKKAFMNVIIDDSDVADGASDLILVSGTLTITWLFLGDY